MNNIKKIGLTALAGSLVALGSANSGEMSVSGGINATLKFGAGSGSQNTGRSIGADRDVSFTGGGELDNGMVWKNELFYDYLEHTKYQSWGFTAFYPGVDIIELRSSLTFEISGDAMTSSNIIGINYRTEDLEMNHAWFDETFDFRDMTVGPTANDRISPAVFDPYAAGAELITDPNTGAVSNPDKIISIRSK